MDGGWMGVKGRGQRGGGTRGSPHWQKRAKKVEGGFTRPGARAGGGHAVTVRVQ